MKEFEINGIQYEEIPKKEGKKSPKTSLQLMATMAMSLEITNPYNLPARKPLPTDNVIKEFELIQLKKSKLSRSERDRVVAVFNRRYRIKSLN